MPDIPLVVSTIVMGVLLVVIVTILTEFGTPRSTWITSNRRYVPERKENEQPRSPFAGIADKTGVWMTAFFVLTFGFGLAAITLIGGFGIMVSELLVIAVLGLFAVVLALYLGIGVYVLARNHGHPASLAAAQAVFVLALLGLLSIVFKLVFCTPVSVCT